VTPPPSQAFPSEYDTAIRQVQLATKAALADGHKLLEVRPAAAAAAATWVDILPGPCIPCPVWAGVGQGGHMSTTPTTRQWHGWSGGAGIVLDRTALVGVQHTSYFHTYSTYIGQANTDVRHEQTRQSLEQCIPAMTLQTYILGVGYAHAVAYIGATAHSQRSLSPPLPTCSPHPALLLCASVR
jgi:hypothetical protein